MALGKYLALLNGKPVEEQAINASAGAGSADKIARLDATGKFDATFMPAGVAGETRSMVASEALSAGDLVNFWNDAGTPKMRKADADASREAQGFVLSAVASGASGTVYPEEAVVTGLAGMTTGATQFLGTAAGARVEACPTGTGVLAQIVGIALSATEMMFRPETPIAQA